MKSNRAKNRAQRACRGLSLTEVLEILVICDDSEGMVSYLQPMPPHSGRAWWPTGPYSRYVILFHWGRCLWIVYGRLEAWQITGISEAPLMTGELATPWWQLPSLGPSGLPPDRWCSGGTAQWGDGTLLSPAWGRGGTDGASGQPDQCGGYGWPGSRSIWGYHRCKLSKLWRNSQNTSFINSWKTRGALARPYRTTRYS